MFKKRHQGEMPTRCLRDVVLLGVLPTRMVGVKRLPTRRLRETNPGSFLQMHTIMLPPRDAYAILPTQNAYSSLCDQFLVPFL
eukprot:Skav209884  [mRNA]  locus=scaffold2642:197148:197396:+ [translate_table: standard]